MIDFRTWEAGRIVFRLQDGKTKICPRCKEVGAVLNNLPGQVVHEAILIPIPGRKASRLSPVVSCSSGKSP